MKLLSDFLLRFYTALMVIAGFGFVIMAIGVCQGNQYCKATLLIACAIYLVCWPDPNDSKINDSIINPYHNGKR